MKPVTPVARLSLGLVALTGTILLGLDFVGFLPNHESVSLESRLAFSETLAAEGSAAASSRDLGPLRRSLQISVERNPELLSAGLRSAGGRLLLGAGEHRHLWSPEKKSGSSPTHVRVPLLKDGKPWAELELRFTAPEMGAAAAIWSRPVVRLLAATSVLGFLAYAFYLRRSLRHLDPSAVIPTRVQAALDVMTEGVLLLDPEERIVLANAAFAERLSRLPESLLGLRASDLGWRAPSGAPTSAPWSETLSEGRTCTGTAVRLETDAGPRIFMVNASPVLDGWGRPKGAIATFDDVTELSRKTQALETAIAELEKSQEEIRLQNEELEELARRDPLTGVANRRAFMELLEGLFADSRHQHKELSCLMLDIDHFKSVNDTHGHAAGDEVIRRLADALSTEVSSSDFVCRYGGEEFCVALPGATAEAAAEVGERLRKKVQSPGFARVPITVSLGLSTLGDRAADAAGLIDQADQALYASKEAGRNRVTRWSELPQSKS